MSNGGADLLTKARAGMKWLNRNHAGWLEDQPSRSSVAPYELHTDEDFSSILKQTDLMERELRAGGFEGCLFADDPEDEDGCPEDAVMTCDSCLLARKPTDESEAEVLGEASEPLAEPIRAPEAPVDSEGGAETPVEGTPDPLDPRQMGFF